MLVFMILEILVNVFLKIFSLGVFYLKLLAMFATVRMKVIHRDALGGGVL